MKRRPMVIAGLALAALTALGGAAAYAAGPSPAPAGTEKAQAAATEKVEVRDGKIYRNGEQVGTVSKGADHVVVSNKNGKVTVGEGKGIERGHITKNCPAPDADGRSVETTEVKDGKIYRNGKEAGRVTGDGTAPLTVANVDGKIQVNKDDNPPAGAHTTRRAGDGKGKDDGPVVSCVKGR